MDLQLKKVHFSEQLSEETNAFTADIWFRGKKVGYAKNSGRGGCTDIHSYDLGREALQEAEAYAKTLPEIVYEGRGGLDGFSIDSDLEAQVDEMFTTWLEKKEITKYSNKGIFYEDSVGRRSTISWKSHSIAQLKKHPQGRVTIQNALDKVVAKGGKVLNTNLQGYKF